ncbi:hypothetical protein [Winogradskyella haliclonae]|uniref:Type IV pilus biogenesis n=1 Tax=Winogradskyella haliclonae TaxID=2048558 RepID=A0ABQ2C1U6_9FLAO|nr:hypothetical protein [Winogradskyella haliclonae]GGI57738.1 hypothetical protein GCM10011444_20470 [Winogradskyella haliclonae]
MKTKKKTYLLLVVVISVWGTIAYKIIAAYSEDMPEINTPNLALHTDYKLEYAKDTFSIQPLERDPFLGTIYKPKAQSKSVVKKQKEVLWKPIEYLGVIANERDKIFIISIANKQTLFKTGQQLDSIKLIRGNKKYITLRYKHQNKTFKLKQ